MKTLSALVLGLFLAASSYASDNLSDSDQKWKSVVAEMISAGPTTISTPHEHRVKIAKELAQKAGRKVAVEKSENGFRIKVS